MSICSTLISFHGVLVQSSMLLWKRKGQIEMLHCVRNAVRLVGLCCGPQMHSRFSYLDKNDQIPHGFDMDDIGATLAQLLVIGEANLKQIGSVLQCLHFCLHCGDRSIRLEIYI